MTLGLDARVSTPSKTLKWLREQAARALRLVHEHGEWETLCKAVENAEPTESQYAMWKEYAARLDANKPHAGGDRLEDHGRTRSKMGQQ